MENCSEIYKESRNISKSLFKINKVNPDFDKRGSRLMHIPLLFKMDKPNEYYIMSIAIEDYVDKNKLYNFILEEIGLAAEDTADNPVSNQLEYFLNKASDTLYSKLKKVYTDEFESISVLLVRSILDETRSNN